MYGETKTMNLDKQIISLKKKLSELKDRRASKEGWEEFR